MVGTEPRFGTHDRQPTASRIRRLVDTCALSLVVALCIFGDSELIERFARSSFELLGDWWTNSTEEVLAALHGQPDRASTAVVMITRNENDIEDIADRWPLPLAAYRRFAERAWCLGARAVFFDVGFPHTPGSADTSDPTAPATGEIPAFIRAVEDLQHHTRADCPEWSRHDRGNQTMPVLLAEQYDRPLRSMETPEGPHYVSTFVADDMLYRPFGPGEPEGPAQLPSAAMALARPECAYAKFRSADPGPRPPPCPDTIEIRDTSLTPVEQRTFPLVGPQDHACMYKEDTVVAAVAAVPRQLGSYVTALFSHLIQGRVGNWQACPPILTIPWHIAFDPRRDADVAAALDDRLVLVSASVSGVSDMAETELHQNIPGVYVHALAAEALANQWVGPARPAPWQQRIAILFAGTLLVLGTRSLVTAGRGPRARRPVSRRLREARWTIVQIGQARALLGTRSSAGLAHKRRLHPASLSRSPRTKWTLGPVIPALLLLFLVYWYLEWKVSLVARDSLYFVICNYEDIWWLDPAQVFHRAIEWQKERLQSD